MHSSTIILLIEPVSKEKLLYISFHHCSIESHEKPQPIAITVLLNCRESVRIRLLRFARPQTPPAYLCFVLVHADDVLRYVEICGLVALIKHHEEQIEPAHDGRADLFHKVGRRNEPSGGGRGGGHVIPAMKIGISTREGGSSDTNQVRFRMNSSQVLKRTCSNTCGRCCFIRSRNGVCRSEKKTDRLIFSRNCPEKR